MTMEPQGDRGQVRILGVNIDDVSLREALERVAGMIVSGGQHLLVTPYAESLVAAHKNASYRAVLNQADLAVPDGVSLRAAATYLSIPRKGFLSSLLDGLRVGWWIVTAPERLTGLKARVTGVALMERLCRLAAERGWRVMLLGGYGDVSRQAALALKKRHPKLRVESFAGTADVSRESREEYEETRRRINRCRPHLLFVAYGPATQERWLAARLDELDVKVAMGVGGAFDYLAGKRARAPGWMRARGLEWLYRLIREPRRLRRQLALPKFAWLVFREKVTGRDRRQNEN
jgi:N-acetylglucosaminyldiphosphoundecaprenol N-acetyl-beta-D-mannosaminyltransferase